jgi:EpsI family protein
VNFYVASYASQRKGQSAHSPRSCIPGGGWEIQDISPLEIDGVQFHGQAARANRVEIQKGRHRQLVYYWFQQRGRVITSEYEVKMRLLLDSIQLNRTDGALVRLTTVIRAGESWEVGDRRLTEFMQSLSGQLDAYVPS